MPLKGVKIGKGKKRTYKNFNAVKRAVSKSKGLKGKRSAAYTAAVLRKMGKLHRRKSKK